MRTTTHLDRFISVFQREGIPYSVHATTDFRKLMDTADLREMLRCLVHPDDSRAWIHTLRSSFFGLPDTDICRAVATGTSGWLCESDSCPETVLSVNGVLRQLRRNAETLPLRDFLPVLLFETDFIAVIAATSHQKGRRLASMQHILEKALTGETRTVRDLLVEMDEDLAPSVTQEPVSLPEEGDAVTVTTIHKAKGLAFRHVFLAGLETGMRGPGRHDLLLDPGSARAAFSFSRGACTAWWPDLRTREKSRALAELRRLLYVAVTRAEETLTIFRTPPRGTLSPAAVLSSALDEALEQDPGCCRTGKLEHTVSRPAPPKPADDMHGCTPPPPDESDLFPVSVTAEVSSYELELGSAVHALLEKADLSDPPGWISRNTGGLESAFGELCTEAIELAEAFFETDLPVDLGDCRVIGREYPYIVNTVSGPRTRYVDMLLDTGDGLVVLDYKTDHIPDGDLSAAAAEYMETQEFYVRDLAEAFGRPVTGYLVFLRERACLEVGTSA
jgi:ATP-dependent exoDNAse (exonuclease V) beta subunit